MVTYTNSIVIPIYNNEEFIPDLMLCCQHLKNNLDGTTNFIFVVDGSPDRSLELLELQLPQQKFPSKLIVLSRNFGSFSAIRTGLQNANGSYTFFMAADLQEPPTFIIEAAKILKSDKFDIVIGKRKDRDDGLFTDLSSNIFWSLYRKIIPDVPRGGVDIFACRAQVRDSLLELQESNTSLIGQIFWLGYRKTELEYSRISRQHGKSGWTLKKKIKYLLDSVFNFTDFPLKVLLSIGFIGCAISFVLGLTLTIFRINGTISVPGYVAIMVTIMFFGSLNLLGMGILGEYLHRTFDNTKKRSASVVRKIVDFES